MSESAFLVISLVFLLIVIVFGAIAMRNDRRHRKQEHTLNVGLDELSRIVDARHRQVYGRSSTILTEQMSKPS